MPHDLIHNYYTAFNERRFADAADPFAEDGVMEHPPYGEARRGRDTYLAMSEMWVQAYPDGRFQVGHINLRDDTIYEVEVVFTGTHQGDFALPAWA